MPPTLFRYRAFVAIAAAGAVMWLVYLSVMLFEHRKVLKEMGVL